MPGVDHFSARVSTQHGLRSIALAAALQAMACSMGAAQTTSALQGVLRGWFRLPHGVDLHQLRISAPGFVFGWKDLSSVAQPTGFPGLAPSRAEGQRPLDRRGIGETGVRLRGVRTVRDPSCVVEQRDQDRSRAGARSHRPEPGFFSEGSGSRTTPAIRSRVPRSSRLGAFRGGTTGTTRCGDGAGARILMGSPMWSGSTTRISWRCSETTATSPARFSPPLGTTLTLRRSFPLRVHVPLSVVPKYPFCLEAVAWIPGYDGVTEDGLPVAPFHKAIFDDSGTATIFVPLKSIYQVMVSVKIEKSFFCDPRSGAGYRLALPEMTIRIGSQAGTMIPPRPS